MKRTLRTSALWNAYLIYKKAFTLIELLVVVAIIAVLIAILLPSLQSARSQARKLVCATNLRQIAMGIIDYAYDHHGELPLSGYTQWQNCWSLSAIESVSSRTGTLNEDAGYAKNITSPGQQQASIPDIIARYGDVFACPSVRRSYDWWIRRPRAGDPAGTEICIYMDYELQVFNFNYEDRPVWVQGPRRRLDQAQSEYWPDLPLSEAIGGDIIAWMQHAQPYLSGDGYAANHIPGYHRTPSSVQHGQLLPVDGDVGGNTMYVDGRVEWHQGNELTLNMYQSGYGMWWD